MLENTAVTRPIPTILRLQLISLFVLRILFTAGLIFVGIWACVRRGTSAAVRALSFYCAATAVSMLVGTVVLPDAYAGFRLPFQRTLLFVFGCLALLSPAFWLKLQLLFPHTNRIYGKYRVIANIILLLPAVTTTAVFLRWPKLGAPTAMTYSVIFLSAGFLLLLRNHIRAETSLVKRQTRLVLWGSGPGMLFSVVSSVAILFANPLLTRLSLVTRLYLLNLHFLLILLIPLSFAHAFGRYRLLEVEAKLKRGTRFAALNAALLVVFVGFLYTFAELLLKRLGIESRTPTLVLGLALALAFAPVQRRLRHLLERRFYPERARLRGLVRSFLRSAERTTDARAFWKELARKLASGLSATMVYPALTGRAAVLRPTNGNAVPPAGLADSLTGQLVNADFPLVVDELLASGRLNLGGEHRQWMIDHGVTILLPLRTASGSLGYLLLGRKTDGEDYTSDELNLLRTLARQIALAAENRQLLEEQIEKKKLEEQLGIARGIQEGLLPGILPSIQGLELAARIRFCMDVAGDYYDVVPLQDGRALLAIGDVAGKGLGAALLMANLQASLRVVRNVGISLSAVVHEINGLVCENTPTNMFITFFVAIFDPESRRLTYVNAGHNPPLLLRGNGDIEHLVTGGLLLGVTPDSVYTEECVQLDEGDALFMFTDGVSEAMDRTKQEFGEDRIAAVARSNQDRPLEQALSRIEEDVIRFIGKDRFEDDFTLLAVRVGPSLRACPLGQLVDSAAGALR